MPLNTHESVKPTGVLSSPDSQSNFWQLAISSDLAATSVRDLIDAQFYGSFHLCKVKTFRVENFAQFCQMRCQCWQTESSMFIFFIFICRSKITYIASFLFSDSCFSSAQIANFTPSSHSCPIRQPPCFACALQLSTLYLHCSLMHRQTSWSQRRNSKTLPQLH